jgi:hypothetical protein
MNPFLRRLMGLRSKVTPPITRNPKAVRRAGRIALRVDALEDRVVPATMLVNAVTDTGAGAIINGTPTGDLRYCITQANLPANTGSTIVFDNFVFANNRTVNTTSTLSITQPTTIQGPLDPITLLPRVTVNRNSATLFSVFTASTTGTLTMSGLRVTNGANNSGGGIESTGVGATVNLNYMVISGNAGGRNGGGIEMHATTNTLNVRNSTISGNTVLGWGGGISFYYGGNLLVQNSTISGNQQTYAPTAAYPNVGGGGIYFYGQPLASFVIQNSTIANNTSAGSGGGVLILNNPTGGTLQVQNSTITGNTAGATAAGYGGGGIARLSPSTTNVTINSSIVAGNTNINGNDILSTGTVQANFSAIGTTGGYSLNGASANNIAPGTALGLGTLGNQGGPTQVVGFQPTSPLVNTGANPNNFTTDQRGPGFVRSSPLATQTDIGALERQGPAILRMWPTSVLPTTTVSPPAATQATNANAVTFTVLFSQPVTLPTDAMGNYIASNFAVVTTGGVTANPISAWTVQPVGGIAPSTTWTITVTGVTGTGTLQLKLTNTNLIVPGINASGVGLLSTPIVTVDQTAPTLVGFTQSSPNPLPVGQTTASYTVTFSEPVTGLTAANFGILAGSVLGASVTGVSMVAASQVIDPITFQVSATQWTVNIGGWSATANGTVGIQIVNGIGVADPAGNPLTIPTPPADQAPVYGVGTAVISITPNTLATNGTSVTFTITFTRPMTGVQVSNFTLVPTGGVTGVIGTPTGGGTTWTVTVTGIPTTANGTLSLQMQNGTGVVPAPQNLPVTSPAVTIDHVNPNALSIGPSNPASNLVPTNAGSVVFVVTFSEPVVVPASLATAASYFTVTGAAVSGGPDLTTRAITAVTAVGNTWLVTVNTGATGQGTVALAFNPASAANIADPAGNLVNTPLPPDNPAYTDDHVAPAATTFTLDSPTSTTATLLHFQVTFSEPVGHLVGGVLNTLTTSDFIPVGGGGSFFPSPTVQTVSGSGNLWDVYVSVPANSSPVAGGTINLGVLSSGATDAAGNAVPTATSPTGYFVDTTAPTVASIVANGPALTNAFSVDFTVTFTEPVSGDDQALFSNFSLTGPGAVGAAITGVSGSGNTRTVTVSTGADGVLGLDLTSAGTIVDTSVPTQHNPLAGTPVTGGTVTIDHTAPTVQSIVPVGSVNTGANPVQFTVTFSEAVTGLDTTAPANANLQLVSPTIQSPAISSVTGSGAVYTVTVNTGLGDGTLGLDLFDTVGITDLAGNSLSGLFTGTPFNIDHTPPQLVLIAPQAPATFAQTFDFNVHFNEAVTGLDPAGSDFAINASGVFGATITGVTGSGQDWVVTVDTGSGDGTLSVYLVNPVPATSAIADLAGNPLQVGPYTDTPVTIDKTPPTVTIAPAPGQSATTNTLPIRLVATFSEPVTGFGAGALTLGGTVAPGSVVVSGTGTTYTITLDGVPQSGTITVGTAVGAATDAAGNPTTPPAPLNLTYDRPVPTKPDSYTTSARTTLAVDAAHGVSANDGDASTPAGTVKLATPPVISDGTPAGTVTLNPDGSFVFTPFPGITGDVTFTYTATDGLTDSQPVPVTVTVVGRTSYSAEAAGPGGGPIINVLAPNGKIVRTFYAYAPDFTGGVQVAVGDFNGDGVDDIVAGTGIGGGPNVKIFDGATGDLIASFFAYEDSFRGGVQVAVADVNHDGKPDVITGTGFGGGPRVRVFDLSGGKPTVLYDFMAYDSGFRGGVMVAGGDVDGDGLAEILVGAGPGGGPHVKVYKTPSLQVIKSFYAFDANFGGGVSIAVGDVFADGVPDIIVGATSGSQVRAFNGKTGALTAEIPFTFPEPTGGVRVATQDTNNDGRGDVLLMATGPGDPPRVVRLNLDTLLPLDEVLDYPQDFRGGLYVG